LKPVLAWITRSLATCGFLTYLPAHWKWGAKNWTGAGFIGTLAGLATCSVLQTSPFRCLLILIGGTCLAIAVSDYAEELLGNPDDSRIVIDEWIGYWFAIAFLPQALPMRIAAFVLFRLFDVVKPGWIRRAGGWPGGWGIVMDDVFAGILANLLLQVSYYVYISGVRSG
jgi:phosphatidylglycerophosphatase A